MQQLHKIILDVGPADGRRVSSFTRTCGMYTQSVVEQSIEHTFAIQIQWQCPSTFEALQSANDVFDD